MDEDIELDNLGEDRPIEPEEGEEEETNIDDDWRDESVIIIGGFNPDIRQGLDTNIPNPRKDVSVIRRAYTEYKKNLLRELGIFLKKGDGPSAKSVFEKLKVTVNRKGKVDGAEFDGVNVIVQKGKKLVYTEDKKKLAKVREFKELVKNAELEHKKTPAAVVEETLPDITVSTDLEQSVLRNSIENLESFIDDKVAEIEANSVTLDREKIREFRGIAKTGDHNLDNGGLKTQETYFRDLAKAEPNVLKKKLYEEMADVCVLKADEIRLRRNERPESLTVQSMIEEEAQNNDLTRFERFKKWAKKTSEVSL